MIRPTPALDQFGALILVGFFLLLLLLQRKFPLRQQNFSALRRFVRNTLFPTPGFALARISLIPFPLLTAMWAGQHHFGVLHLVPIPRWLAITLGVLLMDYIYWWWHVALHLVPSLWRFHNVHHSDLDMDVTTAVRYRFASSLWPRSVSISGRS